MTETESGAQILPRPSMNANLRAIGSDIFTTTGMQRHRHDRCSRVVGTGVDPVTSRSSDRIGSFFR